MCFLHDESMNGGGAKNCPTYLQEFLNNNIK